MNFFKRISFYFFGFLVGLVFLFYIMDKKSATFNYSPNKRVLGDISKKKWILENGDNFQDLNKDDFTINFKVDFSNSNVGKDSCKIYYIKEKAGNNLFEVKNCSTEATFKKLNL